MSKQEAKNKVVEKFLSTREVRMTSRVNKHVRYTGSKSLCFDVEGRAIEKLAVVVVKPFTVLGRDTWGLRYYDDPDLSGSEVACLAKGDEIQVRLAA